MLNYKVNAQGGFTPAAVAPRCDNSRNGATSSSLSAGAAWGTRHGPLLHSYQHPEFHIKGKGILQSRIFKISVCSVKRGAMDAKVSIQKTGEFFWQNLSPALFYEESRFRE
jgi:hypothetical protein